MSSHWRWSKSKCAQQHPQPSGTCSPRHPASALRLSFLPLLSGLSGLQCLKHSKTSATLVPFYLLLLLHGTLASCLSVCLMGGFLMPFKSLLNVVFSERPSLILLYTIAFPPTLPSMLSSLMVLQHHPFIPFMELVTVYFVDSFYFLSCVIISMRAETLSFFIVSNPKMLPVTLDIYYLFAK